MTPCSCAQIGELALEARSRRASTRARRREHGRFASVVSATSSRDRRASAVRSRESGGDSACRRRSIARLAAQDAREILHELVDTAAALAARVRLEDLDAGLREAPQYESAFSVDALGLHRAQLVERARVEPETNCGSRVAGCVPWGSPFLARRTPQASGRPRSPAAGPPPRRRRRARRRPPAARRRSPRPASREHLGEASP